VHGPCPSQAPEKRSPTRSGPLRLHARIVTHRSRSVDDIRGPQRRRRALRRR
jgi:hypothetical protein